MMCSDQYITHQLIYTCDPNQEEKRIKVFIDLVKPCNSNNSSNENAEAEGIDPKKWEHL